MMQRKTQVQEWSFCRHQPRQRTAAAIEMAIVQISQKINVNKQIQQTNSIDCFSGPSVHCARK